MQEKQPKQQQQEQQQQQNQHQTTTTKPTTLRPKKRTQQKLRFNYEARNSATRSQRVQQPKSSTMAEKLKAQLWLHSRPKKGNFTKERKGEGKKKTNYSPANILQLLLQQLQHVTRLFFFHFFLLATIITNKTHEGENDDHIISNPQLKNLTLTQTTLLHLGETKNKPNQTKPNKKQNPNQTKPKPKPTTKPKTKSNQNQTQTKYKTINQIKPKPNPNHIQNQKPNQT
jgi:hypothetical protein